MAILVLDASIIFDLERGGLLEAAFTLEEPFVTPDLLFVNELEPDEILGPKLRELGLKVVELDSEKGMSVQSHALINKRLSTKAFCGAICDGRTKQRLTC